MVTLLFQKIKQYANYLINSNALDYLHSKKTTPNKESEEKSGNYAIILILLERISAGFIDNKADKPDGRIFLQNNF